MKILLHKIRNEYDSLLMHKQMFELVKRIIHFMIITSFIASAATLLYNFLIDFSVYNVAAQLFIMSIMSILYYFWKINTHPFTLIIYYMAFYFIIILPMMIEIFPTQHIMILTFILYLLIMIILTTDGLLRILLFFSSLLIIVICDLNIILSIMSNPQEFVKFAGAFIGSMIPTSMIIVTVWYFKDKYTTMSNLLYESSMVDSLTGAYNVKVFQQVIKKHRILAETQPAYNYSIAMFDIDNFKNVNDTFGHAVGNQTLKGFSHLVQNMLRKNDVFIRYGGDEFILLLPELNIESAHKVCTRIIKQLDSNSNLLLDDINLTVSVGICDYHQAQQIGTEITKIADQRMYEAKKAGKTRIVAE